MKTIALRMYGKNDLRLEEFTLPAIEKDELLVKVVADSLCMSSYKAAMQGSDHKRVPDDISENPVILGHEIIAEILEVGETHNDKFQVGQKVTLQPAMKGTYDAAGYSFPHLGGDSQYGIIPNVYIEQDAVLPYKGEGYFKGALAEPVSCVIGATHANYHTRQGEYTHIMETVKGGKMALLAGAGPMGLALIDYVVHRENRPSMFLVTDVDQDRLDRAAEILTVEEAKKNGVELIYLNTGNLEDPVGKMMELSDGDGYDDVFVFAPISPVIEQGDDILAYDGCLNFFAGPTKTDFKAPFNFYDVHYNASHIVGTSGGNTDDIREALEMSAAGKLDPSILVTHIGGLNAAKEATLNLPNLPGGKKLIYNHISLPLTDIEDFEEKGKTDPLFAELAKLVKENNGLWSNQAEAYLLENAPKLTL